MRKWWVYENVKKKLEKKEKNWTKILSIRSRLNLKIKQRLNINFLIKKEYFLMNCYPNICKSSMKFKKVIKMGKTTRWVFFHNLKKNKITNISKYVW